MDSDNPVVKLCVEGMQAEAEQRFDDARMLFMQAWHASKDDYDACIAAHFVARQQQHPEDTLRWNQEALNRAHAAGDERVHDFYPSLYLNMGYSYERFDNVVEASRYYELAASQVDDLPRDRYGDMVRYGIEEGRKRIAALQA